MIIKGIVFLLILTIGLLPAANAFASRITINPAIAERLPYQSIERLVLMADSLGERDIPAHKKIDHQPGNCHLIEGRAAHLCGGCALFRYLGLFLQTSYKDKPYLPNSPLLFSRVITPETKPPIPHL